MLLRGLLLPLILAVSVFGCSTPKTSPGGTSTGVTSPGPTIVAYCSTVQTHSPAITITGTAQYVRREIFGDSTPSTSGGLGDPGAPRPIRYTEIRVTNSAGSEVQCGETLADGTFSVTVPQVPDTYTVTVRARAQNTRLNALVLDTVAGGNLYAMSTTVVVNGAGPFSVGTMTASATGDIMGAPFNILDQFLEANEYLRTKVGACSGTFAGCPNFTVADKVTAYWSKGLNPNSYYLGGSSGLSFYIPGYSRLFILGGKNGDTDNSDTDHFDNSIILHEYAHFLEDTEFKNDSPGGQHTGTKMIDPRLAWSEGWGNFFQAAVLNAPFYIDTIGNKDGSTYYAFYLDLENASGGSVAHDHLDQPNELGEGNFREFSISRLLWDTIDDTAAETVNGAADNVNEAADFSFRQLWAALTKSTEGFNNTNAAFRSVGLMHLNQVALGITAWTNLRTIEHHKPNTSEYAQYVTTGSSCTYSITPIASTGASLSNSDYLLRNNDYYHFKVTTAGSYTIRLDYVDSNGAGGLADIDLYVYNEKARFGNSADIVGYSWTDPSGGVAATQSEEVTLNLAVGNYLINVFVFSADGASGAINYTLKSNGSELCSATLPNP